MSYTKREFVSGSILITCDSDHFVSKRAGTSLQHHQRSAAEDRAAAQCEVLIRGRATYPLSVKVDRFGGVGTDLDGTGGKPRVAMRFDAKNALGNELPYMANCDFGTDPPTLIISK